MGKLNLEAWKCIGALDHILQWIEFGSKINFTEKPKKCIMKNRVQGAKKFNFVDKQINKLLSQGAITECKTGEIPHCVLPIHCVPKKNGQLRLVVDCRHGEPVHICSQV